MVGYALPLYVEPLPSYANDMAPVVHLLLRSGISAQHAPMDAWRSVDFEDVSATATEDRLKPFRFLIQHGVDLETVCDHPT